MIPLEQQVISLEQAKKLKALGVKQESLYTYHRYLPANDEKLVPWEYVHNSLNPKFSAFTCAELFAALPEGYYLDKEDNKYEMMQKDEDGRLEEIFELGKIDATELFDNPTQAIANLLIHLLESKIITVNEINERI